ncbi:MAG: signal peptidase I [Candidatus Peregrinibacteria bacterium]
MKPPTKKILLWFLDLGINIVIIFGLVLIIQKWLIAPFDVSGASMCNTLNFLDDQCVSGYGEKIIINEAGYIFSEPKRGDIVVFKAENSDDKYFIKRIIGLPGEIVEIKDGFVFVNGEQLKEPYLNEENKGKTNAFFSNLSVFEVPVESYFMLGDNRKSSTDSRSCFQSAISISCKENKHLSFIPKDKIRGKAWIVWWPLSSIRLIDHPSYIINSESLEEK